MVHVCGGVAALCGAVTLGPRIGRFDENGQAQPIPGHSVPVSVNSDIALAYINGWQINNEYEPTTNNGSSLLLCYDDKDFLS